MASQDVIRIMDEFNWDVEYICQALIEARNELEKKENEINELQKQIMNLEASNDKKDTLA